MVYKNPGYGSVYSKIACFCNKVAGLITKTPPQADLDVAVANVLDIWAKIDPNRIIVKPKLHILTHLKDDVRRFGPPVLYETEVFEASNKVFRQCSVLSNHHAPSHDISMTMAHLERFKHIISGGWWWDNMTKKHIQAGKSVVEGFDSNRFLRHHLGWAPDRQQPPGKALCINSYVCTHTRTHCSLMLGSITYLPKDRQPSNCTWDSLFSDIPPARPSGIGETTRFKLGESTTSRSGDVCSEESWVFYTTHNVCSIPLVLSMYTHSVAISDRIPFKCRTHL